MGGTFNSSRTPAQILTMNRAHRHIQTNQGFQSAEQTRPQTKTPTLIGQKEKGRGFDL